MSAKRVGALAIIEDATLLANAPAFGQIALQHRLPSSGWPGYAVAGGLLSYGINFPDMFRRTATFVDKILKGAKPADLPVEQATKFELIINLKTAKALGLEVPPSLLAARRRGDRMMSGASSSRCSAARRCVAARGAGTADRQVADHRIPGHKYSFGPEAMD